MVIKIIFRSSSFIYNSHSRSPIFEIKAEFYIRFRGCKMTNERGWNYDGLVSRSGRSDLRGGRSAGFLCVTQRLCVSAVKIITAEARRTQRIAEQ